MSPSAETPTHDEIRAAVLGRGGVLPRGEAYALLAASDDPERESLLASVVENGREETTQRSGAAIALGHVPTPQAQELLGRAARSAPPEVLPDILRSLGRIGGTAALPLLERFAAAGEEEVAAAARFGGAVIAHRLGLPDNDLPVPRQDELMLQAASRTQPVEVTRPSAADVRAVLASLEHEPYGIELDSNSVSRFRCGTDVNTMCLNRQFIAPRAARALLERKAILALVALEAREGTGHSVSYIVFSQPAARPDGIDLLAPRCTGRPALAGTADVADDQLRFSLRSIDRPGARAVFLDGVLERGRVRMTTALVSTTRRRGLTPAHAAPRTDSD